MPILLHIHTSHERFSYVQLIEEPWNCFSVMFHRIQIVLSLCFWTSTVCCFILKDCLTAKKKEKLSSFAISVITNLCQFFHSSSSLLQHHFLIFHPFDLPIFPPSVIIMLNQGAFNLLTGSCFQLLHPPFHKLIHFCHLFLVWSNAVHSL